jgi:hypothetical protein
MLGVRTIRCTPTHARPYTTSCDIFGAVCAFFPGENRLLVRSTHHHGRPDLQCGCAFRISVFLDAYAVFTVPLPQTTGRNQIGVNRALYFLASIVHRYVPCPCSRTDCVLAIFLLSCVTWSCTIS